MTTIQSLIDKYSSRSEGLTGIPANEILEDLKGLAESHNLTIDGVIEMVRTTPTGGLGFRPIQNPLSSSDSSLRSHIIQVLQKLKIL